MIKGLIVLQVFILFLLALGRDLDAGYQRRVCLVTGLWLIPASLFGTLAIIGLSYTVVRLQQTWWDRWMEHRWQHQQEAIRRQREIGREQEEEFGLWFAHEKRRDRK